MALRENVYVARQLILDSKQNVYGYELLFRNAEQKSIAIENDLMATTEVLLNTMNSIGIHKMIGDKWGFLNVNEKVLQQHVYETLDRKRFVLEILESTTLTAELVHQIQSMSKQGYTFALDDFVFDSDMIKRFKPIFPYISILKVDLYGNPIDASLSEKLNLLKNYNMKFLAEKVETRESFEQCKSMGFSYFQGYFFSKPEIMQGKRIQNDYLSLLDLFQAVRSNAEGNDVEDTFKRYPDVTMNLLRFMNSTFHGLDLKIGSVAQAIKMMGRKKLLRWLVMMFYTDPRANDSMFTPLLELALQRAKLMENVAKLQYHGDEERTDKAFLAGMLSLVDVIFRIPMATVLLELRVDEDIAKAIKYRTGTLGKMLVLVQAIEVNNVESLAQAMADLNLLPAAVNKILESSYDSFQFT